MTLQAADAHRKDPQLPNLHRIVTLGDIPLRLVAADEAGTAALELTVGALAAGTELPLGTVRTGGPAPALPERPPDQVYDDRQVWLDQDDLLFLDLTGVVGRSGPTAAVIGGGEPGTDLAAIGIRRLFLCSVGHLLGFHDRFLVHAGAVTVDGRTVLVLGASGAGKSTVALAALEQGWPVLSDDLAILRRADDGIDVAGVPRPPTVPTDLQVALDGAARPVADDPRDRAQLPPDVLSPGFRRVDAVLVVGHGSGPLGELTPVAGRDVHLLLVGSFPAASHPDQLRRAHPVFAELSRLPCRQLGHGTDAGRRLASAATAIRELRKALTPPR